MLQNVITYPVFAKFIHILSIFLLISMLSLSRGDDGTMGRDVSNKYARSAPWDAPEIV